MPLLETLVHNGRALVPNKIRLTNMTANPVFCCAEGEMPPDFGCSGTQWYCIATAATLCLAPQREKQAR